MKKISLFILAAIFASIGATLVQAVETGTANQVYTIPATGGPAKFRTSTGTGAPMLGTSPSVTTSILPATNWDGTSGVDLGSSSFVWKDLYLGNQIVYTGTQPASVSGANGTAATAFWSLTAAVGGDTTFTTGTVVGGAGQALSTTAGVGGVASTAASTENRGGAGGANSRTGGVGGAISVSSSALKTGGAGGAASQTGGVGGAVSGVGSGTNTGGAGGASNARAGAGGVATGSTGTNTSGAGGAASSGSGAGGATTATGTLNTGGAGGTATWSAGAGGASSGAGTANVGGAGGTVAVTAGAGGAAANGGTNTGGAGGTLNVTAGAAGAGGTGAIGGIVNITGGAASGDGTVNRAGGDVILKVGASVGTGTPGTMQVVGRTGWAQTATSGTVSAGRGSDLYIDTGTGGEASGSGATQNTGGQAGLFYMNAFSNTGGNASGATTNIGGGGGSWYWYMPRGGTGTGGTTANGGSGANLDFRSGTGGTATGSATTKNGGAGGAWSVLGGPGGPATGTGTNNAGAGAAITISSGAGGDASGGTTNNGGSSGALTLDTGVAGTGSTANGSVGSVLIKTGGTTAITVSGTQNVGIGMTPASQKLEVKGNQRIVNDSGYILWRNTADSASSGVVQMATTGATIGPYLNVPMVFQTNNTARVTIAAAGGTTFAGTITPSAGIVGTSTNDSATAGNVGERTTVNSPTGGTATPGSSTVYVNIASMSLTAGDHDCSATASLGIGATTSMTRIGVSLSDTSITPQTTGGAFHDETRNSGDWIVNSDYTFGLSTRRFSLASTTTIYLVGTLTYTTLGGATWKTLNRINCTRVR